MSSFQNALTPREAYFTNTFHEHLGVEVASHTKVTSKLSEDLPK